MVMVLLDERGRETGELLYAGEGFCVIAEFLPKRFGERGIRDI